MLVYRVLGSGEYVFADFGNSPYNESVWKDASSLPKNEDGSYYKYYREAEGGKKPDIDAIERDIKAVNSAQAKITRDTSYDLPIEVFGVLWQVALIDRMLIYDVINYAMRTGKPEGYTREWKLLDNTYMEVTVSQLEQVLDTRTERVDAIWKQYSEWCLGDQLTAFEYLPQESES